MCPALGEGRIRCCVASRQLCTGACSGVCKVIFPQLCEAELLRDGIGNTVTWTICRVCQGRAYWRNKRTPCAMARLLAGRRSLL